MRLRLEATEDELLEKGERLIEALHKSFQYINPELADILEKALPQKEKVLKYRMLRELDAKVADEYQAMLKRMVADIGQVIDESIKKSDDGDAYFQKGPKYVGPRGGEWADPQHTVHWEPTPAASPAPHHEKHELRPSVGNKMLGGAPEFDLHDGGNFAYEVWKKEPPEAKAKAEKAVKSFSMGVEATFGHMVDGEPMPSVRIMFEPGAADNALDSYYRAAYHLDQNYMKVATSKGHNSLYHEYAHFLDHLLGDPKTVSDKAQATHREGTAMHALVSALLESESAKGWTKMLKGGKVPKKQTPVSKRYEYLTERHEVFARYVDQWCAAKLKSKGMDPKEHANGAAEYKPEPVHGMFSPDDVSGHDELFRKALAEIHAHHGDRDTYKSEFQKAGGPYIGPRGGKWVDPQHTIAWQEPQREARPTETPEFKRWFSGSQVVDDAGKPLRVYHGTPTAGFSEFSAEHRGKNTDSPDAFHTFSFTSNPETADTYSRVSDWETGRLFEQKTGRWPKAVGQPQSATVPVYLSIKNPLVIHDPKNWATPEMVEQAKKDGHDGIIRLYNPKTGEKEYAVFAPTQVKSAVGNTGAFSPSADIAKGEQSAPMQKAFYDHTQPIVQAEEIAYKRVQKLAIARGYKAEDFDKDGVLYGWSTNELLDLLRNKAP